MRGSFKDRLARAAIVLRHRREKPRRLGRGKSGEVGSHECPVRTLPAYLSHSPATVA